MALNSKKDVDYSGMLLTVHRKTSPDAAKYVDDKSIICMTKNLKAMEELIWTQGIGCTLVSTYCFDCW